MKKTKFIICLGVLIIGLNILGINASADVVTKNNMIVSSYSLSKNKIYEGTEFDLTINFQRSGDAVGKDVSLYIDPGSFVVRDKGLLVNLGTNSTTIIPMKCSGSSNIITLTLSYNDGSNDIQSVNKITIDMIKDNASSSTTSTNTTKYKPEILIVNQDTPSTSAGTTLDLSLQLKNVGNHTAKDITVELLPPTDGDFQYETNTISLIDKVAQLKKTETTDLNYSFLVKETTKAKTYKCQLKYTYYNLYGDLTEKTQAIYIKVVKSYPAVDLAITEVTHEPAIIQAGQKVQLSFLVNNNAGLSNVRLLDVSLDGLSEKGFTLLDGVNSKRISHLQPDSKGEKITFDLFASSRLKKGSYPLTVKLVYNDSSYNEQIVEKEIYLMVDSVNADIAIQNIKAPTGQVLSEQVFDLSFDIVNTSDIKAENLVVSINGGEEIVPLSQSLQIIDKIDMGAKKHLSFKLQPTAEAKTKSYLVHIEVKGKDEDAFPTINQYVGVYVKQKKTDDKNIVSKPIIIVDNFTMNPQIVNAGKNFDLKVTFQNTHKTKSVKNVVISMITENDLSNDEKKTDSAFTPVNTSSTFFIDEIAPQQTYEKDLTLFTIPFAASKVHNLNLDIYYEYAGEEGSLNNTIKDAIPVTVVQPSTFITSDINIPETSFVGQPFHLSLEISNTGKTTLDNFTVLVEGFGSSNSKSYLGNIQVGRTTYYDVDLWPNEEGEIIGNLIFTYSKPDGMSEEVKKEIRTMAEVNEINLGDDLEVGNFEQPIPSEVKSNTKLIIIIASVAVVIIISVIIRRKIKKKKEMKFDE